MIPLPRSFAINFRESSGPYRDLFSPNDGAQLSSVQYATPEDVNHLLNLLPKAQAIMGEQPAHARARILRKVAQLIGEESQILAQLIALEGGKPLRDARVEVERAQVTFELCAEEALRLSGETVPMERTPAAMGHLSFTLREPIGAVLAISAFNHPLNLLAHQVGCALAAGCAVVVKPAPATPITAFRLEELLYKAGLPKGVLFVVTGEIPEIERLASSARFAFVSFIGSAKVGWNLRKIIAPGTRLALEHGGQAPAIVRADADLSQAIPALIKGSFYHAGQVCISTQRIFVHETRVEEFTKSFIDGARKLKVGNATCEDTDIGPLIRVSEVKRIQEQIDEALKKGARLLLGNEVSGQGRYLSPTVLSGVKRDCRLMSEEVFGPVVCLNSYRDEDELLSYLNSNDYVFEGCVFTNDLTRALQLAKRLSSMTVVINDHNAYRVDWMPFGGHKLSGLGMGGVRYSIEEMTRLKQVILKY